MKMGGERVPSGNVGLKWKESLPTVATMDGRHSGTSLTGRWTMGGACWCEANLTWQLLPFPLEVLVGPGTQWNPWKVRGRRSGHFLGKGEKRSPHEPEPCGVSWVEVSGQTVASLCCQGTVLAQS